MLEEYLAIRVRPGLLRVRQGSEAVCRRHQAYGPDVVLLSAGGPPAYGRVSSGGVTIMGVAVLLQSTPSIRLNSIK
jgi:hypothetical protein